MRVRQVVGSGVRRETYALVDDDGRVVDLVDDYLALYTDREVAEFLTEVKGHEGLL